LIVCLPLQTAHAGLLDGLLNAAKREAVNTMEDSARRKTRDAAAQSTSEPGRQQPVTRSVNQTTPQAATEAKPPSLPVPASIAAAVDPDSRHFPTRFPDGADAVAVPDDSEASRQEAIARLRSAPPRSVCKDKSTGSQPYGSTCASREYAAPPMLVAPKVQWMVSKGWWAVWSPFLIGDKILTGSCNNEDNKGLNALDIHTGKTLWRIGTICQKNGASEGMGTVSFFELGPELVLFTFGRTNAAADYYVVDVKAGKILRTLKPLKSASSQRLAQLGNVFMAYNTYDSQQKETTYLHGLNTNMDQLLWSHGDYRYSCDNLDSWCVDVFTTGAGEDGVQYFSITDKDQPDPPARRLHAIDAQSGKLLWKHKDQPVTHQGRRGDGIAQFRSNDDSPMLADGKVIIQVTGLLGANRIAGGDPNGYALRALDAKTGAIVWTTDSLPTYFSRHWGDNACTQKESYGKQRLGNRTVVGEIIVTEVIGYCNNKELWAYRLADGKLAWRRPLAAETVTLTASAGGVFYTAQETRVNNEEALILQGLDGLTGTLLWTSKLPGHNVPFLSEWNIRRAASILLQGPSWRIGRDGAIYGITLTGAFKIQ
jgi:outer membrane protein assembly factor BamB